MVINPASIAVVRKGKYTVPSSTKGYGIKCGNPSNGSPPPTLNTKATIKPESAPYQFAHL
jgi:hypothetical protein